MMKQSSNNANMDSKSLTNEANSLEMSDTMMTSMQQYTYEVESFMEENYQLRNNVLSGKTEMLVENEEKEVGPTWEPVTERVKNSMIRHAKKEGICGDTSPKQHIEEYLNSDVIGLYDPIREYLESLPKWDGKNHVAALFSRIPGLNSEQLSWCSTWLRSAVAHWLGMDMQHGNECVPILIGEQGCGKSTFAVRLLPEHLRIYYLDHVNFSNKFDSDMALTHNLLVNLDEFTNMKEAQQGKLKFMLSRVKVNGRPIFGCSQEDRVRYASFLATTNDEHPLCDPTGSRRFLCLHIHKGQLIDNETDINYEQLYAQVLHEVKEEGIPYWFNNDEVKRIQHANMPYFKSEDLEGMLRYCYSIPQDNEQAEWLPCQDIFKTLQTYYPTLPNSNSTKIRIGQTLKYLGCKTKRLSHGMSYQLKPLCSA